MKALAKEKDLLEREKWDLRRQTKEATEQVNILRAQMDMKENRVKELEAELTMVSGPDNPTSGWRGRRESSQPRCCRREVSDRIHACLRASESPSVSESLFSLC